MAKSESRPEPQNILTCDANSTALTVDRNGLGARGIDYLSSTTSSGTTVSYPVYDAHGNMVATLARAGGGYAVSNRRAYDAWGRIRQGATSGGPKGRHCANTGHVQDDETGLTYMRARYYEPTAGRFITEDQGSHGLNYFVYCSNDPVNRVDHSGKYDCGVAVIAFILSLVAGLIATALTQNPWIGLITSCILSAVPSGINAFAKALPQWINNRLGNSVKVLSAPEVEAAEHSHAAEAVTKCAEEAGRITAELIAMDAEMMTAEEFMQMMMNMKYLP